MAVANTHIRGSAALGRLTGWPRVLWVTGTVLLVTMVVHIAALVITGDPMSGPVSLRKPATFAETGWLTAWSVAVILPTLHTRAWQRHVIGTTVILFSVGETAIIGFQAWRGVPSHYNFTTALDAALMRGGAGGTAGIFLIGVIVLLVAALRSGDTSPSLRLGVCAGIIVLLMGCVIGFVMISNNSGVYEGSVGAGFARQTAAYLGPDAATVGPQYGLLRPATRGGDLVAPHIIGIHGLVLLAVPAVLLARTAMSPARQLKVIALAVTSVVVGMVLLLVHALRQLPLDQLNPLALTALALCAIALLAAYAVVGSAVLKSVSLSLAEPRSRLD
ncbi:MAG: hypothetical protein QOH09_1222 [Pseudonocardiales bacterium]|jgi:hypothetical protein|nr:hypothetical protein [Pseudonocardiales bacterium]